LPLECVGAGFVGRTHLLNKACLPLRRARWRLRKPPVHSPSLPKQRQRRSVLDSTVLPRSSPRTFWPLRSIKHWPSSRVARCVKQKRTPSVLSRRESFYFYSFFFRLSSERRSRRHNGGKNENLYFKIGPAQLSRLGQPKNSSVLFDTLAFVPALRCGCVTAHDQQNCNPIRGFFSDEYFQDTER